MSDPSEGALTPASSSLRRRGLTRRVRPQWVLSFLLVASGTPNFQPQSVRVRSEEVEVAAVLDGDSIEVFRSDESREKIRYLAIGAPETKMACGEDARHYHADLLQGKTVWIEWQEKNGAPMGDRDKRLLAYVYRDRELHRPVALDLVRGGYARIDIREVRDRTPQDDFRFKWLGELWAAQRDAAKARRGCWRTPQWCAPADLVITFIKFWGDEIVELVNRSEQPVNLENFLLEDGRKKNTIRFHRLIEPSLRRLPPQGVLRLHSGRGSAEKKGCTMSEQVLDCHWTGKHVWDNSGDLAVLKNTTGEVICQYHYKGR